MAFIDVYTHSDEDLQMLLRSYYAQPEPDTALKIADRLEDLGDEARTEFIRVSCQLVSDPDNKTLHARQQQLFQAHRKEWTFDEWCTMKEFTHGLNHLPRDVGRTSRSMAAFLLTPNGEKEWQTINCHARGHILRDIFCSSPPPLRLIERLAELEQGQERKPDWDGTSKICDWAHDHGERGIAAIIGLGASPERAIEHYLKENNEAKVLPLLNFPFHSYTRQKLLETAIESKASLSLLQEMAGRGVDLSQIKVAESLEHPDSRVALWLINEGAKEEYGFDKGSFGPKYYAHLGNKYPLNYVGLPDALCYAAEKNLPDMADAVLARKDGARLALKVYYDHRHEIRFTALEVAVKPGNPKHTPNPAIVKKLKRIIEAPPLKESLAFYQHSVESGTYRKAELHLPKIVDSHSLGKLLHSAARVGDKELVQELCERGAYVLLGDGEGKIAHQLAEEKGHAELAALLAQWEQAEMDSMQARAAQFAPSGHMTPADMPKPKKSVRR